MQRDMISGDMRFIGTKKETLYQMSKKSKQLFNVYGSFRAESSIKEIKVDEQGYSIAFKVEIEANATASSKIFTNVAYLIPLKRVIGKTVTLQYDDYKSNVPNECAVVGIVYMQNGKYCYRALTSTEKQKAITFSIPKEATGIYVRLFATESASESVLAGKYEVAFKGVMLSVGKTRKKWEPYKE